MTKDFFMRYWYNSKVRCVWDRGVTGIAIDLTDDGYIVVKTETGNMAFTPDQLEWA